MEETILLITEFYVYITDRTEDKLHHKLFIEIFVEKHKISEFTVNDSYYISNSRRRKKNILNIMFIIKQDYGNIIKKIKEMCHKII